MTGKEKLIEMLQNNEIEFIRGIGNSCGCPSGVGLRERGCRKCKTCIKCWEQALKDEVETE